MNSSKRGPVYGFKLASLDSVKTFFSLFMKYFCFHQLTDTRTHDKRLTLLHFIVQTVDERFPDVVRFDTDLQAVEKAAQGNENNFVYDQCNILIFSLKSLQNQNVTHNTRSILF